MTAGPAPSRPVRAGRRQLGFALPEFVAGLGLLVLPVTMLVAMLPVWLEVQSMGHLAAQQAARAAVLAPSDGDAVGAATRAARTVAANHGRRLVGPVRLHGTVEQRPGGPQVLVTATVTVRMPALAVPGLGAVAAFDWGVSSTQPVDVYRSVP